jgi:hypothetical protein
VSREARKRERKARVREEGANPQEKPDMPWKVGRDPATRWQNLSARGGQKLSYLPVGQKVAVDLDDPTAPQALALSFSSLEDSEEN